VLREAANLDKLDAVPPLRTSFLFSKEQGHLLHCPQQFPTPGVTFFQIKLLLCVVPFVDEFFFLTPDLKNGDGELLTDDVFCPDSWLWATE